MSEKICTVCQKLLPLSMFSRKNDKYLQSHCKDCQSIKHRQWYLKNTDKVKTKVKKYKKIKSKANRQFYQDYKTKHGCLICGEKCVVALDFHHIDNNKDIEISKLANSTVSFEAIMREINKCVVLCANCHRKLHAGFIQLPEPTE